VDECTPLVGGTLAPIPELARQLFPSAVPVSVPVSVPISVPMSVPISVDTSVHTAQPAAAPAALSAASAAAAAAAAAAAPPPAAATAAPAPAAADAAATGGRSLTSISCGHVVPRDALLPLAVGTGPSGRALDFSFSARSAPEMIDELGRLLVNACAVAPGGAVVFFPSFTYADHVYSRWVKSGAAAQLARHKAVFREPRTAAKAGLTLVHFSAHPEPF